MRKEISDIVRTIDHDVLIGVTSFDLIAHVQSSSGSETMVASREQGIKEHAHAKSLYFAQNARLTIEGRAYDCGYSFYAIIPANVAHGWQHAGGEGNAVITSFEPGHKKYEHYQLER